MSDENDDFVEFGCFEPYGDCEIIERNLPHWFQPGAALHLTFRLIDSLPAQVVQRIGQNLERWLEQRKFPVLFARAAFHHDPQLRAEIHSTLGERDKREFKVLVSQLTHRSLDECHGSCLLQEPSCARIVADALLHYDGIKYDLDRFVIMPNHVHAIAQFYSSSGRKAVGQSWMRYSARMINRSTGHSGAVWQPEPFDHIIRSPEQFRYIQGYIQSNPAKAKLKPGHFLYWERPS